MGLEFVQGSAASGYDENFGADVPRAADVQRRVADDEDLIIAQILLEEPAAPLAGNPRDAAALLMVVREGSGGEVVPQLQTAQFDLRAQTDVAREQPEQGGRFEGLEAVDKVPHPGADFGPAFLQEMVQPEDIAVKNRRKFSSVGGMAWRAKNSRTRLPSVRPANFNPSKPSLALNSVANTRAKARMPAPPVRRSVPSTSNRTNRIMPIRAGYLPSALASRAAWRFFSFHSQYHATQIVISKRIWRGRAMRTCVMTSGVVKTAPRKRLMMMT